MLCKLFKLGKVDYIVFCLNKLVQLIIKVNAFFNLKMFKPTEKDCDKVHLKKCHDNFASEKKIKNWNSEET